MKLMRTFIKGTGKYIAPCIVPTSFFEDKKREFYTADHIRDQRENKEIAKKLTEITGIKERRYFDGHTTTSQSGTIAAKKAYVSAGVDPNKTEVIVFAHNFGDVRNEKEKFDCVPCHAARIKNHLGIENPYTVAYDVAIGGDSCGKDLHKLKDYLNLGPNDLVVETFEYEIDGLYEKAESAFSYLHVEKEQLQRIIVIHILDETLPLAIKVKNNLSIQNPELLCFDVIFGCPGWLHALNLIDSFIRLGKVKNGLAVGSEGLSLVSDPHDPDSQIYSDGGGATYAEGQEIDVPDKIQNWFYIFASVGAGMNRNVMIYHKDYGILGYLVCSDTLKYLNIIWMDGSYNPERPGMYLKMKGKIVFAYAKGKVPELIKELMDKLGIDISQVKRMFLHQANAT